MGPASGTGNFETFSRGRVPARLAPPGGRGRMGATEHLSQGGLWLRPTRRLSDGPSAAAETDMVHVLSRFLRGFAIGALLAVTFLAMTGAATLLLETLGLSVR